MPNEEFMNMGSAVIDFRNARRKAQWQTLFSRLRGESNDLLPYDEVRRMLKATPSAAQKLEEVPLEAIVGSVGRYSDFTRGFLPKQSSDEWRWARVKLAMESMTGVPPIELYKIGEAYFVKDGNHRVSIARELGNKYIQAYVTSVQTQVRLTPDIKPDELILKAEYADFLSRIPIHDVRPDADLSVTAPGMYVKLEEHIRVHRYYMGLDLQRDVSCEQAIAHWYDTVYLPIVDMLRNLNLLRDFPDRTEADLYLWLSEYREHLKNALGWNIPTEAAAEELADQFSTQAPRVLNRVGDQLLGSLTPVALESGPPPGEWRQRQTARQRADGLFQDILVPITDTESGWRTLDQALGIAQREHGQLFGLHVVPTDAHKERKVVLDLEAEFQRRCAAANVPGSLALETGSVGSTIVERARWADLLVVTLNYPPGSDPLTKLQSGFRNLLLRASVPVLAVPCAIFPLQNALLAYDGSPKSREALYVSTYFAKHWEGFSLLILTAAEAKEAASPVSEQARTYLESHQIAATYLTAKSSNPGKTIVETAQAHNSNLIIMGGYGYTPMVEVVLGSAVNQVLRESRRPVLICR